MEQKIEALSDKEKEWVAAQLEQAVEFVRTFSGQDAKQALSLGALDRAFAAWMTSGSCDSPSDANKVINCVGIAFGRLLVDGIGLEWVIATDNHGSDLAVYGLPGTGDVLVYPANLVAKRWTRHETNFLQDIYGQIERQVRTLSRQFRQ